MSERLAKNIERLRTERQMTQEELAKRVGVSQPAIAQYERGTATPRLYVTVRLANALNTTVEALIEGKEEQNETAEADYHKAE